MATAATAAAAPAPPAAATELVEFLNRSWTAFHAVDECRQRLLKAGYQQLSEREEWRLEPGGKYFFTRNYSTIAAFSIGKKFKPGNAFWIIGAHTDSPCLKLKPNSKASKAGFLSVGVQTYGGGLWHTWFDRDLGIAGRVILRHVEGEAGGEEGGKGGEGGEAGAGEGGGEGGKGASVARVRLEHRLVKIDRPIMRIPTLAIHLDREVNTSGFKPNTQTHLLPVLATAIKEELNRPAPASETGGKEGEAKEKSKGKKDESAERHHPLLLQLLASELGCSPSAIADFDLQLCDTHPSAIAGALNEFVFSGRLDNLASSFAALQALLAAGESESESEEAESGVRMVLLFDNEECGSDSAQGAGSPLLLDAIRRVNAACTSNAAGASEGVVERSLQKSFVVSADMAHCHHPNYPERHEELHQPKMHKGLVIKHNANQRYATTAVTAALFREVATCHGIPVQDFVVRNDTGCGSTIGPILASGAGIRTVDVGAPQLSMHSIREMCGTDDIGHMVNHFTAFFRDFPALDARLTVD
ncbi:unnamed protein product [Closterium sp. Yama58-4]|nr:unnamed protein product [Closterium sp. Yama58-4]